MDTTRHAKSFRDLEVYKQCREVSKQVFELSQTFPKEELYSLTDQVRRSSRSIGAQIAEAWAKRRYEKHFVSKLTDADGEQLETQHWIDTALDCAYVSESVAKNINNNLSAIGKMLHSMMTKSHQFCGKP